MNALIDVVVCTYNRAHLLVKTLDALAIQGAAHDGSWTVTVIDNNCTDGTVELVNSYMERLPSLRIVAETRQGLTEARQRGFWATDAPWVAFIDDDCVPEPAWISEALAYIAHRPDAAGFNGRNVLHMDDGVERPWIHPEMFAAGGPAEDVETERESLHGAGITLRRDAVISSGWLDAPMAPDRRGKSLVSGGDNELAARARAASDGGGVWFAPGCRLHHTIDESRLGFGYLLRLNYRLAEAGPLLLAMQSPTLKKWHRYTARYTAFKFASLIGLRTDHLTVPAGGIRSRLLAAARAVGTLAGYTKLAVRPGRLRSDALSIATPSWVEHRTLGAAQDLPTIRSK